jgi:cation transport ATPase
MTRRKTTDPADRDPRLDDAESTHHRPVDAEVDGSGQRRRLPARKPMARASRLTLFEREVRERLSRAAMDVVFARAESISEGQCQSRGGREAYFGSTMLTIDLPALGDVLRDAADAGTPQRLVPLMELDPEVGVRIREIAAREATRIAVARLKDLKTHVSIRAQEQRIFIDVDVEANV